MIKNIISLVLVLISAALSIKHGWDAFQPSTPEQVKMMENTGITKTMMPYFGALSFIIGVLLLIPQTFVISNILNAITIVLIMSLSLRAGDFKTALIEIPFLTMPLIMIYLKYPFKN